MQRTTAIFGGAISGKKSTPTPPATAAPAQGGSGAPARSATSEPENPDRGPKAAYPGKSGSTIPNSGVTSGGSPQAEASDAAAGIGDDRRTTELARSNRGFLPPEIGLAREGLAVGKQLDAFRELRTRLLSLGQDVGLHRLTVLVAPVTNKSGASFVARNLAAVFTLQEHRRAILVDCNLREPTQHQAFELSDDSDGLFNYLETPGAHPARMLYRTDIKGLYVIPAGRPSSPSREYFSSSAMRTLLTWLQKTVSFPPCFLVLDGPPVIGLPDARILSELADFVILVAGYGRDTVTGVAQAAALFDPAKLAGVVFNTQE